MTRAAPDVSAELASLSDDELTTLIESAPGRPGWGVTRSVEVAGHRVFVKTIPVTDAELGADDPTADVFDLPLAYRYGIGSAGVSAHRELMAHQITTRWVSERLCAGFPLLYHHRLLPLPGQTRIFERLDRYVAYWGGSPEIRSFIEARQGSSYAIALFCEHLPHTLMDWLPENQERIGHVLDRALEITDFLRTSTPQTSSPTANACAWPTSGSSYTRGSPCPKRNETSSTNTSTSTSPSSSGRSRRPRRIVSSSRHPSSTMPSPPSSRSAGWPPTSSTG